MINPGRTIMLSKRNICFFILLLCIFCGCISSMSIKHPKSSLKRICFSLNTLEQKIMNGDVSDTAFNLAGIGWFEAAVVDKDNHDLIFCGRTTQRWPPLTIDDFVVNLRNIMLNEHYPYCSLDPKPENVKKLSDIMSKKVDISNPEYLKAWLRRLRHLKHAVGPQEVVVGGVPEDSNHAYVMIDADYHMKMLSQGHIVFEGIPSLMDIAIKDMKHEIAKGKYPNMTASMSRFWFHLKKGHPTFNIGTDAIMLENCDVVVLTEKQRINADGLLRDSNEEDEQSTKFADLLSSKFQDVATKIDSYAKLENLYRLHSLIKAIRKSKIAEDFFDFSFFLEHYEYRYSYTLKPTMPGLVNARMEVITKKDAQYIKSFKLLPIMAGGVSMEIVIFASQLHNRETNKTTMFVSEVIGSRPNSSALYWSYSIH